MKSTILFLFLALALPVILLGGLVNDYSKTQQGIKAYSEEISRKFK